jgi:hypothetical protein
MDYINYSIILCFDVIKCDKKKGTPSKVAIGLLISYGE